MRERSRNDSLISEANRFGHVEPTGFKGAELARREAVFIGVCNEDGKVSENNGVRMRVVHNTAVFLAQLVDGVEKPLGRRTIEVGQVLEHKISGDQTLHVVGGELVLGRRRSFTFVIPEGYGLVKLKPRTSKP